MKKIVVLLLLLCPAVVVVANDGSFTVSGNQLIPIVETDVRVQKEILSLDRVGNQIKVSVYYEFFNPAEPKDLLVGFEASGPYMFDVENAMKVFPEHPNMRGFTVVMNGSPLSWHVAHINSFGHFDDNYQWVEDPYYKNGSFREMTDRQCKDALKNSDPLDYPFQFVYYFTAHFNTGLNIVQHTYFYDPYGSQGMGWQFSYVLTAACRWANRQIDDFTLHVNLGDRSSFCIEPSFYSSCSEWTFDGAGKVEPGFSAEAYFLGSHDLFHVREGGITFHKTEFRPKGELHAFKPIFFLYWGGSLSNDYIKDFINECYYDLEKPSDLLDPITLENRQLLRNLPFAYRGYVFKTASLQRFFEATPWYVPDPSYVATMDSLNPNERAWVLFWADDSSVPFADLGLSVKWAMCNIGASKPGEYGDYYAWGETNPKTCYNWTSYRFCKGDQDMLTKYCPSGKKEFWGGTDAVADNKSKLEPGDDVAHIKLGGKWRIPTEAEWRELQSRCRWEWTIKNGHYGYEVTGPSGNSIFLPAAGRKYDATLNFDGSGGFYWSSSLNEDLPYRAWYVDFDSGKIGNKSLGRYYGRSVRAVSDY